MKKQLLSVFGCLVLYFGATSQTTVTITATGTAGSYNTGSVNSGGTKNDGNMITINSSTNRGWAKFDLSTLPSAAIITAATCSFTTYSSTTSSATNNLYGFVGDPSVIAGATLYTDCASGTSFNASTWTANAANTKVLNATGISFIQSNLLSPNLCIGFVRGSTNTYNIYGYPGTAAQQPQLVLTYSLLPACSGAPSAGTTVASNTVLCAPQSVNLSLTGATSASGLTYQWQSSPDGSTWSAITSATNAATSQSVSATTYYQCIVACGASTATSTPVMINYGPMPTAGSTVASPTLACVGQAIALSLSGASTLPGLAYQWQSSPDNSTWTSISSATAATTSQTTAATVYYQSILTCGTNTVSSSSVQIGVMTANSYASVPFLEAFDNTWESRCDNQNVPTALNWASNPTTGNNSWRRQDAGSTASWTSATTGTVTPMGTGCADFHSYYASAGSKGNLDVYVDMGTSQNYVTTFYFFNNSGSDSLNVWLSTDGGSTFTFQAGYNTSTSWSLKQIVLGAVNSPSCVVRFTGLSDYGADDIGIDSLKIFTAACITPPVAGTISGPANVNYGSVNNYTIAPATGNMQWYSSNSATGPWTAITSATAAVSQPISATISGTMYLTVIASATGCPNDTSNVSYPVNVNFVGDNVCGAIPLTVGTSTVYYKPFGASVQTGEVAPPGTGCQTNSSWCNNTLNNTMWFTFTAPASGYVSVQSPGFDTQLALWNAAACGDLLSASTATLLAANDDDPNAAAHSGVSYSSYLQAACLTPGTTYYIQLDSYSAASSTDSTLVLITDLGTLDLSFTGLASNYCLPSTVSASLTPAVTGGAFTINTNTTVVTAFTPSLTGVGTQTVTYSLFGCMSSSMTTVANSPTVTSVSSNSAVCSGSSATLTASGATSYTWAPGSQTTTTVVVTPTGSATAVYTVTGTDVSSGCSATSTISINVTPNSTVSVSGPTLACSGQTSTLTATGATNYTWTPGGQTTSSIAVTPTVSTTYTVMGDNCGSTSAVASISVTTSPVLNTISSNTLLCSGQSATLTASGSVSYTWTPGNLTTASIVVTPTITTTYTVTSLSPCGTATNTVMENVSTCTGIESLTASGVSLYPNPNSGSVNIAVSTELVGNTTLEVYDALGKMVVKENLTNAVNTINTSKLQEGIYIYKIYNNDHIVKIGKMVRN